MGALHMAACTARWACCCCQLVGLHCGAVSVMCIVPTSCEVVHAAASQCTASCDGGIVQSPCGWHVLLSGLLAP